MNVKTLSAQHTGKVNGFTEKLVKGGDFWLTTFQRITDKSLPYVFYLEGDGKAFTKYGVSDDPTPSYSMVLKLAALDPRPNVVYIARPCQYTPMNLNPKCNRTYWTDRRMSEEVVSSMNDVIQTLNQDQKFNLVGYSGGGGVAVLIAARNKQVKDILTVAGNLDHISFNQYHKKRPMIGSLNPIDYAGSVNLIPQLHVSGGKDTIVPAFLADKYVKVSNSMCVHQEIFSIISHNNGWERKWKEILTIPIICYKK
jgi:dienelactone hydrolase